MLPSAVLWLLVLAGVIAAIWLAEGATINRLLGLRWRLHVDTGPLMRASSWGDAEVNGMGFRDSVRLVEYRNGWLLQLHWLLGCGKIWLPRSETKIDDADPGAAFDSHHFLIAGPNRVKLDGELAEFLDSPRSAEKKRRRSTPA